MKKTGITVVLLLFMIILIQAKETKMEKTGVHKGYKIGDTATDFKLKNVDTKMVSLSDYKDAKKRISKTHQ